MDKNKKKSTEENEEGEERLEQRDGETEGIKGKEDDITEKVKEFEYKWKRAVADYRNLEARMSEQRSEWIRSANKDLLLRLLPILDTLLLAQLHSQDKTLQVSVGQFLDILKAEGVTKIDPIGKEFDPHLMEALVTGDGEENKVLEELRPGFLLHDKVLRAAQVKVGSGE